MKAATSNTNAGWSVYCHRCFIKGKRGGVAKFAKENAKEFMEWQRKHHNHDSAVAPSWRAS